MVKKIIHFPLKAKWYDMTESGEKCEEYREIKPYWLKRLFHVINLNHTHYEDIDNECAEFYCNPEHYGELKSDIMMGGIVAKDYTHALLRYGYTKRSMVLPIKEITCGYGNPKWGAPTDRPVFIIKYK